MTLRHTTLSSATCAAVLAFVGITPAQADEPPALYGLVDASAQRLQTADPVAAFKWIDGGPITDPPRVGQVLDAVRADASKHRIDPNYVQQVFSDQIDATEGIEYVRFGQWKLNPALAPTVAPDLASSRSAIDGFNRTMVNEIALHWESLHSNDCATEVAAATAAVVAARQLDPLYQDAIAAATRSYCG